jgi:hypothetical protein
MRGTGDDHLLDISPGSAVPKSKTQIELDLSDQNKARLRLHSGQVDSTSGGMTVSVSKYRPLIQLQSAGDGSLLLEMNASFVLVPDRLGDDLLLDPRAQSSSRTSLPYTPVLLAPLKDKSETIVIITPDVGQTIELRSGPSSFDQMDIFAESKPIYVGLLDKGESWQELSVQPAQTEGSWQAEWTHPFLAQWRFVVAADQQSWSRMWGEDSLSLKSTPFLTIDKQSPKLAVVYLFGRSWHTPLSVITPVDLVIGALGVEEGYRLLDEEGIRSYRTAEGSASFRAITTREEQWSRELVHVDSRDPNWVELGVLESMQGLRAVDTPGVRSLIAHFGEDIVGILKGLEDRVAEYEGFLDKLRVFCRSNETTTECSRKLLSDVDDQADALRVEVKRMPVPSEKDVLAALDSLSTALGPGKYLHSTKEYGRLSKVVRASQEAWLEIIRVHREFVKSLRIKSGRAVIRNSELKVVGDTLRSMTQEILRNRHYLEGDWGGESPLRKEED